MKRAVVLFVVVVVLAAGGGGCGFGPSSSPAPPSAPSVTPSPLRAPGWEAVTLHTLCLEVQQSYPNAQDKKPEPIAEAAQTLLAGLGVRVVAGGESCEATLALDVVSRAIGADYVPAGYCYSGSEVEGQAVLTVPGHTSLTVPLSGRQDTPRSIERCPKEPAGAPFKVAWMEALLGALYDLWGPPLLIHALADESVLVRHIAADALIQAGPEAAEAVPALIQALQDADGDVRASAARALREIGPQAIDAVPALIQVLEDAHAGASALAALKAITGQDLAWQTAAWQEWWDTRPADAAAPAPTAPPTPACTRNAVFQADITIPDNTPVQAGQPFVKTWRVRNAGTCDWYAGYRLKFVDGDRMGGPDWVTVPETPAGESAEISAELVAPSEPGRYRGDWQMCLGETDCFGDRIYVQIVSTQ
jgi:hypothetical protein